MQSADALTILEQLTSEDDAENSRDSDVVEIVALLHAFEGRLEDPEYAVSDREPAAVYELLAEVRRNADRVERELIRHLKWGGEGMTWEEVATAIEGQLGGRQAMQKRWARLTDPGRRKPGDMRRGAAIRQRDADPLADVQVRAAELEAAIESAPDEATARQLADELHTLMDGVSNVRVLTGTAERRTVPGVDTTTPPTLVLSWEQHDVQHRADPTSYGVDVDSSAGWTYVLDASDQPPLLWCHRCARYVVPRGPGDVADDDPAPIEPWFEHE